MTAEPIPAGALFTVTTGEYSDYSVHGVFRALKEIDTESLRDEWIRINPDQGEHYQFDEVKFLAYAAKNGLFEQIECWAWHLGSYGCIDRMHLERCEGADARKVK